MKSHLIFEHGKIPLKNLDRAAVERLVKDWGEMGYVGKAPSISNDQLVFFSDCGVIGFEDQQIEIAPKIFADKNMGMVIVMRMLKRVALLHLNRSQGSLLTLQQHVLLDIMIDLFLNLLQTQLRQGLLHQYTTRQETLPSLSGKLNMNKYASEPHPLHFPVTRQLQEVDNPINRTLKGSLRVLLGHATTKELNDRIRLLLRYFEKIGDDLPSPTLLNSLKIGRPQARWAQCFELAKAFLSGHWPGVRTGAARVCSLLLPMPKLFQDYIHSCLIEQVSGKGWKVTKSIEHPLATSAHGEPIVKLKPDHIILDQDDRVVAILDSKWKTPEKPKRNDFFQLFAYAHIYKAPRVALIYPSDGPKESHFYHYTDNTPLDLHYLDMTHLVESQAAFDAHLAKVLAGVYLGSK